MCLPIEQGEIVLIGERHMRHVFQWFAHVANGGTITALFDVKKNTSR